jgi:hypothetical protein
MITSLIIERPRHHDLLNLTTDTPIVDAPIGTMSADLVVSCSDGTMLGIAYCDLTSLFSAIRTKSLTGKLVALKQRWPWAYLIIGAILTPTHDGRNCRNSRGDSSGWGWNAVQGALLSAQEMGVGVLQIPHADLLGATLQTLAKRDRSAIRAKPLREGLFFEPGQDLLMALPGIGEAKADALLEQCGSPHAALWALTDDALDIPGIGPETRRAVRAALGLGTHTALMPMTVLPVSAPPALTEPKRAA